MIRHHHSFPLGTFLITDAYKMIIDLNKKPILSPLQESIIFFISLYFTNDKWLSELFPHVYIYTKIHDLIFFLSLSFFCLIRMMLQNTPKRERREKYAKISRKWWCCYIIQLWEYLWSLSTKCMTFFFHPSYSLSFFYFTQENWKNFSSFTIHLPSRNTKENLTFELFLYR